jgi:hypothetical protein
MTEDLQKLNTALTVELIRVNNLKDKALNQYLTEVNRHGELQARYVELEAKYRKLSPAIEAKPDAEPVFLPESSLSMIQAGHKIVDRFQGCMVCGMKLDEWLISPKSCLSVSLSGAPPE